MQPLLDLSARVGLSLPRLLLVLSLALGLCVMQAVQSFGGRDDWPFTRVPMFSGIAKATKSRSKLVLVEGRRKKERPLPSRVMSKVGRVGMLKAVKGGAPAGVKRAVLPSLCGGKNPPEMGAVRIYKETFDLGSRQQPPQMVDRKLTHTMLLMCPETASRTVSFPARRRPKNSIVLEAEDGILAQGARLVGTDQASGAQAVLLGGPAHREEPSSLSPRITFRLEAPPGPYFVWLRGASEKGTSHDSVWLQVDKKYHGPGSGWGNFRQFSGVGEYCWASAAPTRAKKIRLKGKGPHELSLSLREGPVLLDQIVLTRKWRTHPLHCSEVE